MYGYIKWSYQRFNYLSMIMLRHCRQLESLTNDSSLNLYRATSRGSRFWWRVLISCINRMDMCNEMNASIGVYHTTCIWLPVWYLAVYNVARIRNACEDIRRKLTWTLYFLDISHSPLWDVHIYPVITYSPRKIGSNVVVVSVGGEIESWRLLLKMEDRACLFAWLKVYHFILVFS